jgi:hypothetical protein
MLGLVWLPHGGWCLNIMRSVVTALWAILYALMPDIDRHERSVREIAEKSPGCVARAKLARPAGDFAFNFDCADELNNIEQRVDG